MGLVDSLRRDEAKWTHWREGEIGQCSKCKNYGWVSEIKQWWSVERTISGEVSQVSCVACNEKPKARFEVKEWEWRKLN